MLRRSVTYIALIVLSSRDFIETPGIIEKITHPLAENHINILEMSTMKNDIMIFLAWQDKDIAYRVVKNSINNLLVLRTE